MTTGFGLIEDKVKTIKKIIVWHFCTFVIPKLNKDNLFYSYFINHYTKATTWEDPRVRYQQIGKPVSSAASTTSKENTRHGGTTSHDLLTAGSDGAPMQV